jgi:hypothetical protein
MSGEKMDQQIIPLNNELIDHQEIDHRETDLELIEREKHIQLLRKNNTKFYHPFHVHAGSCAVDKSFAEFDFDAYTETNSLLFAYCSEPIIEFANLKPVKSITYKLIVCIATSNAKTDNPFLLNLEENGNLTEGKTLYWPDFYKVHPCILKEMSCKDRKCDIKHNISSKFWCSNCQGTLFRIESIVRDLIAPVVDFNKIPPVTILQIFKEESNIDLDNESISRDNLEDMNFFFDQDIAKINTIALRMSKSQQQLDEFTTKIHAKKAEDQKALDAIFGERGGSADGYNNIIRKVKDLLRKP